MKKGKWNCIGNTNSKVLIDDDFVYDKATKITAMLREIINGTLYITGSTRWRSWLRHCTTSQKVAGSIPDDVTEFFH